MTPGSAGTARGGQILRGEGPGAAAGVCQSWRETPRAVPRCWTSSPGPPPSLIRIPSPPTSLFPLLPAPSRPWGLREGSRSIPGTSEGNSDLAEPPQHLQGLRWSPCHHHSRTPSPLPPPPGTVGTTGATAAGPSSALPARVAAALSRNRLLPKQLHGMQEGSCHLRVASGLPPTLWVLPSPGEVTPRCGGCGGGRALSPVPSLASPRQGLSRPHAVPFCLPVPHRPPFHVPP